MALLLYFRKPVGWQYTTFVFVGVNSCCLILITISYSLLFYTVRKTQSKTPVLVQDIELAGRFFLMVFTDVLCWAPIIILKISVLCGYELSSKYEPIFDACYLIRGNKITQ